MQELQGGDKYAIRPSSGLHSGFFVRVFSLFAVSELKTGVSAHLRLSWATIGRFCSFGSHRC